MDERIENARRRLEAAEGEHEAHRLALAEVRAMALEHGVSADPAVTRRLTKLSALVASESKTLSAARETLQKIEATQELLDLLGGKEHEQN